MLLNFFLALTALLGQNHDLHRAEDADVEPRREYIPTPHGPQTWEEEELARAALYGDKYGGDMVFPADYNHSDAGMKDVKYRWPGYPGGAVVPYVIDKSLSDHKDLILKGMKEYHKHTCIKFVPRTNEDDYVFLFSGNGCWAAVGKKGGRQQLSLGPKCYYIGLVIHELGHTIGFYHEHQRSDRDRYVTIIPGNVQAGQMHNFAKTDPDKELKFFRYDYDSIQHYGNYAFSKEKNVLVTMKANTGQKLLDPFQKSGFTDADIRSINRLYKCDGE